METKKTFEVVQVIPATTYIRYKVEATNSVEARHMVERYDDSIIKLEESTHEELYGADYDVYELN